MKFSFFISAFLALCAFIGLLFCPAASAGGARAGLLLCSGIIVPSLFPFAVLSNVLLELGLPQKLGKICSPVTRALFGVSGAGSAAFFLGIAGGYPLGAISISEMYSKGALRKSEAERLLSFCDNSGPAFIVSVAGSAVFGSVKIGFFLYGVHILAAILTGIILKSKQHTVRTSALPVTVTSFSGAFTDSVKHATGTMVTVCGFVVFFSVLVGMLDAFGMLSALTGQISSGFGTELHFSRSLLTGLLELGTGTSSMLGLRANATNLSLCSFIIGWGGVSVHAQAAAVIREGGLSPARHAFGKLLHGGLSALVTFFTYSLFF
ncbi:MAG: sporulation protein [Oscillospiraceae bacterium]|nr:sporulation protein [Oscillospiraceae bacterium]